MAHGPAANLFSGDDGARHSEDGIDDAALALALQDEYEREYQRWTERQRHFHEPVVPMQADSLQINHSGSHLERPATSATCTIQTPESAAPQSHHYFAEPFGASTSEPSDVPIGLTESVGHAPVSDAAYARQVEQEQSFFVTTEPHVWSDEDYARRLEQELMDEEVARQAFAEERSRSARIVPVAPPGRKYQTCCVVSLFSIAIVAAIVLGVVFQNGNGGSTPNSGWPFDPDRFRGEDPFNQANPEDANLWRNSGVGLELTVINALDTNWHSAFTTAVQQWDAGTPDALTLLTEAGTPDADCSAVTGRLKVCNGDYGATDWLGINQVLLGDGWIYSSVARLNDYYTSEDDVERMQYTMCHEIGHGFGLPHTDESFSNRDLGNCMDYTNNPGNNMQPAEANFIFLSQLYGTVDGSPVPNATSDTGTTVASSAEDPETERTFGNRHLRAVPRSVSMALETLEFRNAPRTGTNGWRRLHQSSRGEAHELDLGEGFTVRISVLR